MTIPTPFSVVTTTFIQPLSTMKNGQNTLNIFLERIQAELILYDRGKAIDPPSEIGPSAGDIDLFEASKIS